MIPGIESLQNPTENELGPYILWEQFFRAHSQWNGREPHRAHALGLDPGSEIGNTAIVEPSQESQLDFSVSAYKNNKGFSHK